MRNAASNAQQTLIEDIASFYDDPLGYVLYNFPWNTPGTPLANHTGPRTWQREFLIQWGAEIKQRGFTGTEPVLPINIARGSGHGIGKTALAAWICKFIHDTRPYSRGTVTANTDTQLKTKTWAEVGKWHEMSLTRHWSDYFASRGNMRLVNVQNPATWFVQAQTCEERNSEAFAGQHAENSTSFYVFDESSAVPNKIKEVSDGGLTDGEPMRFAFGNLTRNRGWFYDAAHKQKHRWLYDHIDSRDVEGTNKELIQQWIDDYGEDSDYVRVRVRGLAPRSGSIQFISQELITGAQKRPAVSDAFAPIVIGVDVARFGHHQSVIRARHGRNARTYPVRRYRGVSTDQLARFVVEYRNEIEATGARVAAIFVDGAGVGGGVVDQLRALGCGNVIEVSGGERAYDGKKYANKRAECWGLLRDWLKIGAIDSKDSALQYDLESCEYGFTGKSQILLADKRQLNLDDPDDSDSPDDGDALALTFAEPVQSITKYPTGSTKLQSDINPHDLL
jgi:hypothetical protein